MKRNGYIGEITSKKGYFIKGGKTGYTVTIPENYTSKEAFAADELKRILSLKNVAIDIVTENSENVGPTVYIGNTKAFSRLGIVLSGKEFKRDGFIIETVGDDFILNTSGDSGNLYAVQTFMGHLADYTFYALGEEKIKEGDIPLKEFHIREIPSFFGRNAFCYESFYKKDYAVRIRSDHPDFSEMYGSTYWSSLTAHTYAADILPSDKYAEEHPDWYSFPKDRPFGKLPQICFAKGLYDDSENGFFQTFMSNLINRFIIPEKDKSFFMLGISDHNEYCRCEACEKEIQKYGISGLSMRFVNKVADAVEAWRVKNAPDREIFLVTFAYIFLMDAPAIKKDGVYVPIDESVVARDNVIVRIAPLCADYRYPIMDEEHNPSDAESIKAWSAVAKNLAVWDYSQDFNSHAFPYPSRHALEESINSYYKYHIIDVFHQRDQVSAGVQSLNIADSFAITAKLWNVKENYNELYNEFIDAYYKDCADNIREYIAYLDVLCGFMAQRGYKGDIHYGVQMRPELFRIEEVREMQRILGGALNKAKGIKDPSLSSKVYDRIYPLTFFCKWVLLCCFGKDVTTDEYNKTIRDLRYNTQKYEVYSFRSTYTISVGADTCEEVLDVLDKYRGNCLEKLAK